MVKKIKETETELQDLKRIKAHIKRIEQRENQILEHQEAILRKEKDLLNLVGWQNVISDGISKWEVILLRNIFIQRFKRRKFLWSVTLAFAIVLFWRGAWMLLDQTPGLSSPVLSLAAGLFLLWLTNKISSLGD